MRRYFQILGLLVILMGASCGDSALVVGPMPVALLDERYSYDVNVERGWTDDEFYTIEKTEGDLPTGIFLDDDGVIYGTPTETGLFSFELSLYEGTESVDLGDSEDFMMFVTEPSTNSQCPLPNREGLTEVYFCLGTPSVTLAEDRDFTLDVTLYVDPERASDMGLNRLVIDIRYDSAVIAPNVDLFTSQALREAATAANTEWSYNNDTAGVLVITLEGGGDEIYSWPGRLLDLPFRVLDDATLAATSTITLGDGSALAGNDSPDLVLIDGSVSGAD